jgi:hypothetical protein
VSQARFNKRDRERTRREKATAKADRRAERKNNPNDTRGTTTPEEQEALLAELAVLHARFEAEEISFDDFLAAKQALTEQLSVD